MAEIREAQVKAALLAWERYWRANIYSGARALDAMRAALEDAAKVVEDAGSKWRACQCSWGLGHQHLRAYCEDRA